MAARDEVTGRNVWRMVTESYSRQAPGTLSVSMTAGDGTVTIVSVTSEHPFHVQDWDGKVETMVAALNEAPAIDASRLFPSDGKTRFGEWVKAGALKEGDQVSARDSVEPSAANDNGQTIAGASGELLAANYNQPLTITDTIRDNRAARVYNFEVESRSGEITHSYFVGDDAAWVHNGRGAAWKKIFNDPTTPSFIRGWIQQELNRGRKFWNLRTPPGCDLGHHPAFSANAGFGHGPRSRLEWTADNRGRGGRFRR